MMQGQFTSLENEIHDLMPQYFSSHGYLRVLVVDSLERRYVLYNQYFNLLPGLFAPKRVFIKKFMDDEVYCK